MWINIDTRGHKKSQNILAGSNTPDQKGLISQLQNNVSENSFMQILKTYKNLNIGETQFEIFEFFIHIHFQNQ